MAISPVQPAAFDAAKYMERLTKIRRSMALQSPFFGALSFRLDFAVDRSVPVAATDGVKVVFNPDAMDKMRDSELLYVFAHEILHCALEHLYRRGSRDAGRWNKAADIVVNATVDAEGIGMAPQAFPPLRDAGLHSTGGGTVEGIYNLLPEDEDGDGGEGGGDGDGFGRDILPAAGGEANAEQAAADWKIATLQAAQAAKRAGALSDGVLRLVKDALAPRVDWRTVLQSFLQRAKADDRTFARPSRRWLSQGIYLPSRGGETLGPIVVAVDCSMSITDRVLAGFAAEIRAIHADTQPVALHVVYFDAAVCHMDSFGPQDSVAINHHGGGGTRFSPIFRHVADQQLDPVACVVLTDLECEDYGDAPGYPVLWVSIQQGTAPFGQVVVMKD